MTTNKARDNLLEATTLNTEAVGAIRNLAKQADDERKVDVETYLRCPRCYGHHSVHGNFDNLCDGCVRTILEYFPSHESVAGIKASLQLTGSA